MKNLFILAIGALFMTSCSPKPKQDIESVSFTKNGEKGAKDVESFFDGHCKYNIDSAGKKLTIELSGSDVVEKERPANLFFHVAYRFYRNLNRDKYNCDQLKVVLVYADKHQAISDFPLKDLDMVAPKMPLIDRVANLVKDKKYNELSLMINDTVLREIDRDKMIEDLKILDSTYGMVKDYEPLYFWRWELDNKKEMIQVYCMMNREKGKNKFNIYFNADEKSEEIYKITDSLESGKNRNDVLYILTKPHKSK